MPRKTHRRAVVGITYPERVQDALKRGVLSPSDVGETTLTKKDKEKLREKGGKQWSGPYHI